MAISPPPPATASTKPARTPTAPRAARTQISNTDEDPETVNAACWHEAARFAMGRRRGRRGIFRDVIPAGEPGSSKRQRRGLCSGSGVYWVPDQVRDDEGVGRLYWYCLSERSVGFELVFHSA